MGVHRTKGLILAGYYGFNENISITCEWTGEGGTQLRLAVPHERVRGSRERSGFSLELFFFSPYINMFQAIKILSAYPTYLRFGLSCKFLGDFWVYLKLKIDRSTPQFQGLSLHFIPDL